MTAHKIYIDDFDDTDYKVIAIHSGLEDYRIAYFINSALEIHLSICPHQIELKAENTYACFNHYSYNDLNHDVLWNLIPNKSYFQSEILIESSSLFADEDAAFRSFVYLLPELKTVDYILKIDNADEAFETEYVIERLRSLKFISHVYELEENKIKNKNNLIF